MSGNVSIYQRNSSLKKNCGKEEGYYVFPAANIRLARWKNFVVEPLMYFKKFVKWEKFMDIRRISRFFVEKFFVSQCWKASGNPSEFRKVCGVRKVLCIIGGYHVSPSRLFCLTVAKNSVGGTLQFNRKILVRKNMMLNRRVSRFSVETF